VLSAGTAATWNIGASSQAVAAMRRHGLDLSSHNSRPLTPGLVEDADAIFVMAAHHGDSIRRILPEAAAKIRLLDPAGSDIADPVGASVDTFLRCADAMQRFLRQQLAAI